MILERPPGIVWTTRFSALTSSAGSSTFSVSSRTMSVSVQSLAISAMPRALKSNVPPSSELRTRLIDALLTDVLPELLGPERLYTAVSVSNGTLVLPERSFR
jgi:hypothetical protein